MNRRTRQKELSRLEKELLQKEKPQNDNLLILNSESFDEYGELTMSGYNSIKEQGRFIDLLHKVTIAIPKDKLDSFSEKIKTFIITEILSIRKEERANNKLSALLLGIGAVFIATTYFLNNAKVIQEIFIVASWVFTWMAVERICFHRIGFKHKKMQLLQIVDAEVVSSQP